MNLRDATLVAHREIGPDGAVQVADARHDVHGDDPFIETGVVHFRAVVELADGNDRVSCRVKPVPPASGMIQTNGILFAVRRRGVPGLPSSCRLSPPSRCAAR